MKEHKQIELLLIKSFSYLFLDYILTLNIVSSLSGLVDIIATLTPVIFSIFAKKYPRIEVDEWKKDGENYKAYFKNRQGTELETLFMPDGMVMSTTTSVAPSRYPRIILKDLDQRYPNAKLSFIQKVDYDTKYKRTVTDRKLEQYFYVELTEKIKGRKDVKTIKLLYDKSFKFQGLAGAADDYEYDEE